MITPEEALEKILEHLGPLPSERVSCAETLGMVLAGEVRARRASPGADNSAMDGYAVVASDTAGASEESPRTLPLVGASVAGEPFDGELQAGQVARITTGAIVPPGATAVVPQELVEARDGEVVLTAPVKEGANIRRRGEEYGEGEVILPAGTPVRPAGVALMVGAGVSEVEVVRVPTVEVVVTGDELVTPEEAADNPTSPVDSNGPLLRACLDEARVPRVQVGRCGDDPEALAEKLRRGLERADVVITTGGASVGPLDVVARAWELAGVETVFWKVAIKPGKPLRFGVARRGDRVIPVFGLPGNPLAVLTGFQRFVRPAIELLRGGAPRRETARLPLATPRRVKWWAEVVYGAIEGGRFVPARHQGSGMMRGAAVSPASALLPGESREIGAGELVEVTGSPEGSGS